MAAGSPKLQADVTPDAGRSELLRFERALVELSVGFVNLPSDEVDAAITAALRRLADTMEVERINLLRRDPDDRVYVSHSAAVAGVPPSPRNLLPHYPWGLGELRQNRHVAFSRLADVPAHATVDRASWSRIGVASNMTVPIFVGGEFTGALAMATFSYGRQWSPELVERARMLATVLGNALEHQRAQQQLAAAMAFERMVSHALADLVQAQRSELDDTIVSALRRAGDVLGADSVVLWQREGAAAVMRPTHEYTREGVHHPPDLANAATFPWTLGEILANRAVSMPVAAMPPAAAVDVATFAALDARSVVVVPVAFGGRVVGALAFASEDDEYVGPGSLLPRIQLFGELLASVLARSRAERGEQDARAEATHAARLGTIGVVAASLAHELTQPLAAIMTNAEMALQLSAADEIDVAELRATLEDILADDRRAGNLIQQLRRFLRRDELDRTGIDVPALLQEAMSLVRGEVVGKGVGLSLACPPTLPRVTGNHAQLLQVLLNLLLNAFDAVAGNAAARRHVTLEAQVEGATVVVSVTDNGIGMDEAAQERAFVPFYTTKAKGMGLGLAISRSIAEGHGGTLTLRSTAGEGSSFRFVLPAAEEIA